jgi:hypothetical protein
MNGKRILITGVVVFVAFQVMGILVHGLWLGPTYSELMGEVWRSEAELYGNTWIMQGTTVIFCLAFAYLFARGYKGGGWREGVWFGFVAYFFVGFQAVFHAYATYPIPLDLALKWFASGLPMSMILGVLASLVYKPAAPLRESIGERN